MIPTRRTRQVLIRVLVLTYDKQWSLHQDCPKCLNQHIVFTVSPSKALHRGRRLHIDTNVGGCPWHEFGSNWGMSAIMCSMPKVHVVRVDLPQDIPTPIHIFWQALTNMVTAARKLDTPVVITAKHSRGHEGMWRPQTFRKWRSLFTFQHARHCFCAYGMWIHSRPFHWKVKGLSLGINS